MDIYWTFTIYAITAYVSYKEQWRNMIKQCEIQGQIKWHNEDI